jgi:hypothetical protein
MAEKKTQKERKKERRKEGMGGRRRWLRLGLI